MDFSPKAAVLKSLVHLGSLAEQEVRVCEDNAPEVLATRTEPLADLSIMSIEALQPCIEFLSEITEGDLEVNRDEINDVFGQVSHPQERLMVSLIFRCWFFQTVPHSCLLAFVRLDPNV